MDKYLPEILKEKAAATPDKVIFTFMKDGVNVSDTLTFAELDKQAKGLAKQFVKQKLKGERALLLYPSGIDFLVSFFACLYAGVIAVPAYPPRRNRHSERIKNIIEDCDAKIILTCSSTKFASDRAMQYVEGMEILNTDLFEAKASKSRLPRKTKGDSIAFLQYTSGSTGNPKGVMISHNNLIQNIQNLQNMGGYQPGDCLVSWLPVFHDMGLIYGMLMPLNSGMPVYFMPPSVFVKHPIKWLNAISKYRGTHAAAPNFAYDLCLKIPSEKLAHLDLSHWRSAINGAEPVREKTHQAWMEKFKAYGFQDKAWSPSYGMAENTLAISSCIHTMDARFFKLQQANGATTTEKEEASYSTFSTCGEVQENIEVIIWDSVNNAPSPDGVEGEIWIAGPSVGQGYWNNPEQTKATFQNYLSDGSGPYLRTGDLGFKQEGELILTGRVKDLIIIRGKNIYPQDVETTVENCHPLLVENASIAFSIDVDGLEKLVVVQEIPRYIESFDGPEMIGTIQKELGAKYELSAHHILLVKPLVIPKTSSGKVQRRTCKKQFLEGSIDAFYSWTSEDFQKKQVKSHSNGFELTSFRKWLIEQVSTILEVPMTHLSDAEPLHFFGLDSLKATRLAGIIEERIGEEFSPTLFYDYSTLAELISYLNQKVNVAVSGLSPKIERAQTLDAIAIVGMACRFPAAPDLNSFWSLLSNGQSGIGDILDAPFSTRAIRQEIENLPADYAHLRKGGYLENVSAFDPEFFNILPQETYYIDPQQRLLLEVCWEALEHAGIPKEELKGRKVGVFIGISNQEYHQLFEQQEMDSLAYLGTGNAVSIAANRLSYFLNISGPSMAVDTACSSSLVAVHQASNSLKNGECDLAIVGGVNLILRTKIGKVFSDAGMLSKNSQCRTFDNQSNGYVRGEGCGIVILQALDQAQQEGKSIHAILKGSAINQDGKSNGLTAPSGLAQQEVIKMALANAKMDPEEVGYVESHGTGTPLGDPIEYNALKAIYGKSKKPCYIGAVKSNIGHLEAAAGIAGLIKTVLVLKHQTIPANLHLTKINEQIKLEGTSFKLPQQIIPWNEINQTAAISSFGFGGTNAHLILEKGETAKDVSIAKEKLARKSPYLLTFSAQSQTTLLLTAESYLAVLKNTTNEELAAICYASNRQRSHFEYRLAWSGAELNDFINPLENWINTNKVEQVKRCTRQPQLLFAFGGQGTQYPKMGQQLYQSASVFKENMDFCEQYFSAHLDYSILDVLYQSTAIPQSTYYLQPLLFSIEYSLAKLMESWGILPSVLVGHSLGEYVAACFAGVFSLKDACKIIALRAKLMATQTEDGRMLAVKASVEEARQWIVGKTDQVSIASINGAERVVLSGAKTVIEALQQDLKTREVSCKLLEVEQGFHSPLMQPIISEFNELLSTLTFNVPKYPIVSALTGNVVREEIAQASYWSKHILEPVNFHQAMQTLGQMDIDASLELSPQPIIEGFFLAQGVPFDTQLFAGMESKASNWKTLSTTISELYQLGITIDWSAVHEQIVLPAITLPKYPFQRKDYWLSPNFQLGQSFDKKEEGMKRNAQTENTHETTLSQLQELTGELFGIPANKLPIDKSLVEMGVDSIILLRVLKKVEKIFFVKISPRQIFENLKTLKAIADYIEVNRPKGSPPNTAVSKMEVPAIPIQEKAPIPIPVKSVLNGAPTHSYSEGAPNTNRIMELQLEALQKTIEKQLIVLQGAPLVEQAKASRQDDAPIAKRQATFETSTTLPPVKYDTRILQEPVPLTEQQQLFIEQLISRFTEKTKGSKTYAQQYRSRLSDWINSIDFRKSLKELSYPIVSKNSKGARIWDVDGNEYLDLAIGYGVNFFGLQPDFIVQAIQDQLEKGYELAVQSSLAGPVADLIYDLTGYDRVTFCNTGTEAVMVAIRLARAVTKRNKIVIFSGYYHGTFDGNLGQKDLENENLPIRPVAPGVVPNAVKDILILEIDQAQSLETIRAHKDELAAILIEPVQSRQPGIFPIAFLRSLHELATELGITLIFDEIITGFRVHPQGAQGLLGFKADITTYGKIVGGGMPIGVVAGKRKYLDAIDGGHWQFGDQSHPTVDTTIFGGTFCKHPLALAASHSVLSHIKTQGMSLYSGINQRMERFAKTINEFFTGSNVKLRVDHFGSLFRFMGEGKYNLLLRPIELDVFFRLLLDKGIYTWERRICFLSTAHTDQDIDLLITKIKAAIEEMVAAGFFPEAKLGQVSTPSINSDQPVPLLQVQKQLLTLHQFAPNGSLGYHITTAIRLKGKLVVQRLQTALEELVARHEALRTVIQADGLHQVFLPKHQIELQLLDYGQKQNGVLGQLVENLFEKEISSSFQLQQNPALRATLVKVAEQEHLLIFTGHHIIYDGWSVAVLMQELASLYNQNTTTSTNKIPQFSEFVHRELSKSNTPDFLASKKFWLQKFKEIDTLFEFPTDKNRPLNPTYAGRRIRRFVGNDLKENLAAVGSKQGNTPFLTFLATFAIALHRLSGKKNILIGVPINNRDLLEESGMIGFAASILPLFIELEANMTFDHVLEVVQKAFLDAFEHRDCSLPHIIEEIKEQIGGNNPGLISVVFNLDSNALLPVFDGLDLSLEAIPIQYVTHDLGIDLIDLGDRLQIECDYSTELYEQDTVIRLLDTFEELMHGVLKHPDAVISKLPLLKADDLQQILKDFNDTATTFDRLEPLPELFKSFTQYEDQLAAVYRQEGISYKVLHQKSNQLARLLRTQGLEDGDMVALWRPRDLMTLTSIVGILKSKGIYVPMDHQNAKERTKKQLADSQSRFIITDAEMIKTYQDFWTDLETVDTIVCLDQPDNIEELKTMLGTKRLFVQSDWEEQSTENLDLVYNLSDCAYMLFTSGSTGVPKGALLNHEGAVNHIWAEIKDLELEEGFSFLQSANLSSDIHVWQFLAPLLVGGKVVIVDKDELLDFDKITLILEDQKVSIVEWVPSYIKDYLIYAEELEEEGTAVSFSKLKWLMSTGEEISVDLVNQWFRQFPDIKILNAYGPCEASDDVIQEIITAPLDPNQAKVSIGKPIANMNALIVDEQLELLPIGFVGEIIISGIGLGLGYFRNEVETQKKFIKNPFPNTLGEQIYKTGDLGKWLPDGRIEFLGRKDQQVQIRGMRVELGEIENQLLRFPLVKSCAVIWNPKPQQGDQLHAYLLLEKMEASKMEDFTTILKDIKQFLRKALPPHMLPSHYSIIEKMPLNLSGKIDRKALAKSTPLNVAQETTQAEVTDPLTQQLLDIWQLGFKSTTLGIHDNFFDLGGHSLAAAVILNQVNRKLKKKLNIQQFYEHPSIAELADFLGESKKEVLSTIPKAPVQEYYPVSPSQKRIWIEEMINEELEAYNMNGAFVIEGPLNIEALTKSFDVLIEQHESFRTIFLLEEGDPVQVIKPVSDVPFNLEYIDLRDKPTTTEDDWSPQLLGFLDGLFDLSEGPLIRALLMQLEDEKYIFGISMHHIISDGWSLEVIQKDIKTSYSAFIAGKRPIVSPSEIQYKDYTLWYLALLETKALEDARAYWKNKLVNAAEPLSLPTDFERPAIKTYNGKKIFIDLGEELSQEILAIAQRERVGLFVFLLSGLAMLLHRISGQDKIIIGTPVAGRERAELEKVVGFFINSLPIIMDVDLKISFLDFLKYVQKQCTDAYKHQVYPLDVAILEFDLATDRSRSPIFDIFINVDKMSEESDMILPGLDVTNLKFEEEFSQFDISFDFEEYENRVGLILEYNPDLYSEWRCLRMLKQLQNVYREAIANQNQPLATLNVLESYELELYKIISKTLDIPFQQIHADLNLVEDTDKLEGQFDLFCQTIKEEMKLEVSPNDIWLYQTPYRLLQFFDTQQSLESIEGAKFKKPNKLRRKSIIQRKNKQ